MQSNSYWSKVDHLILSRGSSAVRIPRKRGGLEEDSHSTGAWKWVKSYSLMLEFLVQGDVVKCMHISCFEHATKQNHGRRLPPFLSIISYWKQNLELLRNINRNSQILTKRRASVVAAASWRELPLKAYPAWAAVSVNWGLQMVVCSSYWAAHTTSGSSLSQLPCHVGQLAKTTWQYIPQHLT